MSSGVQDDAGGEVVGGLVSALYCLFLVMAFVGLATWRRAAMEGTT